MKNPNGYGSVIKLSGNRRNPFAVRITAGFDEYGKQLYRYVNYHSARSAALIALAEFNKNPYNLDLDSSKLTFKDVYEKWSSEKYIVKDEQHPYGTSRSNIIGYKAAWRICKKIEDMKFIDVKLPHMQMIVDESGKNRPTLRKLKVLLGQLFDYAVVNEIISKDRHIVEYVNINKSGNPNAYDRKPFSAKELSVLWANVTKNEYIQVILMLIYSGVRISELLDLKKENVFIDERYFNVIDSKTDAGIRDVPISFKTIEFFKYWMSKNKCEYLLSTREGQRFTYRNYYDSYWKPFMEEFNFDHTPHCTRHTTISLLTKAKVEERIIKMIVGHEGAMSLTERVYTHWEIKQLTDAIDLI